MSEVLEREEFTITTDSAADWAVCKILDAQEERDRVIALAKEKIAYYEHVAEKAARDCDYNTATLKEKLCDYMQTVKTKDAKTQKSYKLASGKLVYKLPGKKLVKDDEALLAFAKENAPEFVKTTESLAWADYKATLKETPSGFVDSDGQPVKGVTFESTPAVFEVKA